MPFTAQTRMSGLDLPDGASLRKGAGSAVRAWVEEEGPLPPTAASQLAALVDGVSESGALPSWSR